MVPPEQPVRLLSSTAGGAVWEPQSLGTVRHVARPRAIHAAALARCMHVGATICEQSIIVCSAPCPARLSKDAAACLRRNDLSTGVRATAAMVAGTQSSLSASAGLVGAAVGELLLPALRERMPAARSALLSDVYRIDETRAGRSSTLGRVACLHDSPHQSSAGGLLAELRVASSRYKRMLRKGYVQKAPHVHVQVQWRLACSSERRWGTGALAWRSWLQGQRWLRRKRVPHWRPQTCCAWLAVSPALRARCGCPQSLHRRDSGQNGVRGAVQRGGACRADTKGIWTGGTAGAMDAESEWAFQYRHRCSLD